MFQVHKTLSAVADFFFSDQGARNKIFEVYAKDMTKFVAGMFPFQDNYKLSGRTSKIDVSFQVSLVFHETLCFFVAFTRDSLFFFFGRRTECFSFQDQQMLFDMDNTICKIFARFLPLITINPEESDDDTDLGSDYDDLDSEYAFLQTPKKKLTFRLRTSRVPDFFT